MGVWDDAAPTYRNPDSNYPTLLYSWWCTGFSVTIILTRVLGRKLRSNVLFREDWIILLALIPLCIRMAVVHLVLLYDTNNIQTKGISFTETELYHRSIGSKLVLVSRIAYAAFIWTCKLTISEFLKRITARVWRKSYEIVLQGIRAFLALTFLAVVTATLAECHPFDHYWQVVPDPGHACRQGYAQLITMGSCDIITDVLLVVFPIPLVLRSGQTWRRKLQLTSLFSLSCIMIAITATRIPEVIAHHGRQQYRTVWASSEILAAAAVSSAVILGSFLRDKGTKKNKFRSSTTGTVNSVDQTSNRRSTVVLTHEFGSDEDLFRGLGIRMPRHLRDQTEFHPRPAPAACPAHLSSQVKGRRLPDLPSIAVDDQVREEIEDERSLSGLPSPSPLTHRSMSFFDVGGLLSDGDASSDNRSRSNTVTEYGTIAQDFASRTEQSQQGSRAFLSDIGGILAPSGAGHRPTRPDPSDAASGVTRQDALIGVLVPMLERHETQNSLQDPGGLLSDEGNLHVSSDVDSAVVTTIGSAQYQGNLQGVGGLLYKNASKE